MRLVVGVNAASSWFLFGVIVFVQVVHYPLFVFADALRYPAFAEAHSRLTSTVVVVPMIAEAATSAWLAVRPPRRSARVLAWAGVALVVGLWLSTAFLQVPEHARLDDGFDPAAHARLVATNWIRTVFWGARALLVCALLRYTEGESATS